MFLAAYGDDGRELPDALSVEKMGPRELLETLARRRRQKARGEREPGP